MALVLLTIVTFLMALLAMAFFTLFERKFLAHAQMRKGPSKVGIVGLPQPLADALKLFLKQRLVPLSANRVGFVVAPGLSLVLALVMWLLYPHMFVAGVITFGGLFFLVVSSLTVYSLLAAGWCSNSKYALLGTMRAIAQTISYEVSMALFLISSFLLLFSLSFVVPVYTRVVAVSLLVPVLGVVWFVSLLAETNRAPFDFAEGESELVSGFNIEYGGGSFAFIFMAEYANILAMSLFSALLFVGTFGGSVVGFAVMLMSGLGLAGMFVGVRATLPRMRYDQLMMLTWKSYLPFALFLMALLVVVCGCV